MEGQMSGTGAYEVEAAVPTDMGELGAVVRLPASNGDPLPGVVLVDGAGEGDRFDWGCWPECVSDAGSVVLRHDKPGCGGSPGHWIEQTIPDRASYAQMVTQSAHCRGDGWVDARADMIRHGAAPASVLAEQTKYADRPWYTTALYPYHTPAILRFARNIFDFDPATVMSQVRCPVLAMFGGADPTIPVHTSLRGFADYLHPHPQRHRRVPQR
jgi:pimeloyl-ACP methyl ester carboxylesterase